MKNKYLFPIILLVLIWSCEKTENNGNNDKIVDEITSPVNAIAIDKENTKWLGTDLGLYKSLAVGYEFIELSDTGKIYSLFYEEDDNTLWIGTQSALLKAALGSEIISTEKVDASNLSHSQINSIYIDNDSKRWFGSEKGISLNDDDNWKKEDFSVNSQNSLFKMAIENYSINSISSWDGDYFFATSGAKLYRAYDYNEAVDAFSGASQWDPPYNGMSITDTMFVVFIDKDGYQWMGGKEGIQVHAGHDPKDFSAFIYFYDELPDSHVLAINQAPNGNIWVGTRKGLAIYNGQDWEIITEQLPNLFVTSIAFDIDGSAWIGTKKGLVILQ